MVIGLKHGKTKADDDDAREKTYDLVNEFVRRFQERNGTMLCRELLGHDLGTDEGRESIAVQNLIVARCPGFVRDAGEILEAILG